MALEPWLNFSLLLRGVGAQVSLALNCTEDRGGALCKTAGVVLSVLSARVGAVRSPLWFPSELIIAPPSLVCHNLLL